MQYKHGPTSVDVPFLPISLSIQINHSLLRGSLKILGHIPERTFHVQHPEYGNTSAEGFCTYSEAPSEGPTSALAQATCLYNTATENFPELPRTPLSANILMQRNNWLLD